MDEKRKRVKLPIDNFQILGVGIGADSRTILTVLEKRIEKSRFEGFSKDALQRRKEMLMECSQVLLNPEMRKNYEENYTKRNNEGGNKGMEIQQNNTVGALILLLEAGEPQEALSLASREINSWRTTVADGGTTYRDYSLIMDYATLDYAAKLKAGRYYEASAEIIRKRLEDIDKPVLSEDNRAQMKEEIKRLVPYRVLDMISRQNDEKSRIMGIELLEKLVQERGGLESNSDLYISQKEFVAFFQQIREYLTVQEQIELFTRWGRGGSKVANFLAGIALVASGFAQRKADRVREALKTMQEIKQEELGPIISNIHLLLGDIETAEELFEKHADVLLKEWSMAQSTDKLGQLCIWCQEWLQRDVLPGYKDIRVDANLEAYFGDKDVTAYLEDLTSLEKTQRHQNQPTEYKYGNQGELGRKVSQLLEEKHVLIEKDKWLQILATKMGHRLEFLRKRGNERSIILGVITTSILGLTLFSRMYLLKDGSEEMKKQIKETAPMDKLNEPHDAKANDIKVILRKYLETKKEVLMGNSVPNNAGEYLTAGAIQRIKEEYRKNTLEGKRQIINVEIRHIKVIESTNRTKKVIATLRYSDKTIDANGKELATTAIHDFDRYYKLVSNGNRWLVN